MRKLFLVLIAIAMLVMGCSRPRNADEAIYQQGLKDCYQESYRANYNPYYLHGRLWDEYNEGRRECDAGQGIKPLGQVIRDAIAGIR
jgi:hypothetical protein